jgi:hypothetical protein
MKKVLFVAAVALMAISFSSCKKDYTCKCTAAGQPDINLELKDVKKKDAKDACNSAGSVYILGGYTCSI